ncbi:MAG TPA: MAPEG family protein [Caulobacteraceae bacterium]|nr:MAPEG family protein [Caulobacteraceae bacterium]
MPYQAPVVSAVTGGILIILQSLFMFAAANQRRQHGPSLGEAQEPDMIRAIRRHGNLAENAGIFVVCAALLEVLGGSRYWVEILCAVFVVARLSHGLGLSMKNPSNAFRIAGVILTAVAGLGVGIRLIWMAAAHIPYGL